MHLYTKEQLEQALKDVSSMIDKCHKIHHKFKEGTSQHTLLKNRVQAMNISRIVLIEEMLNNQYLHIEVINQFIDNSINIFNKKEYREAIVPVQSIIHKCQKAIEKHALNTATSTVLKRTIDAMGICKTLINRKVEDK